LDQFVTKQAAAKQRKVNINPSTTMLTRSAVVLTPQAMQAMMICHEQFLQIMAAELATVGEEETKPSAKSTKSTTTAAAATTASGLSVVQPTHVVSAIEQLGWEELVPPVDLSSKKTKKGRGRRSAVSSSSPKAAVKKRTGKKKREWSADELAAQERLIAGSKLRLEQMER
jgi:hypothetical protein